MSRARASVTPAEPMRFGRVLFLCQDPTKVQRQLAGQALSSEQAAPLREDISTDEITPLTCMVHFDATLGRYAHIGFTAGGKHPIAIGALQQAKIEVLVGGRRYGKGSSREHSPIAELAAGVRLVVAESFERIYRQNADNLGLFTSTDFGLLERIACGEAISLEDLLNGRDDQAAAILRAGGLLRYGLGLQPSLHANSSLETGTAKPFTLFEKIVARHRENAGFVRADWRFIHEYYTGLCAHLLAEHAGPQLALHEPRSIVCFEDHLPYAPQSPAHVAQGLLPHVRRLSQAHRQFAAQHGLQDHGYAPGHPDGGGGSEGISHALMAERFAQPGQLIAGTDSHTPHSGALGCVAIGVGTTDMANAFLTGAVRLGQVPVLRIEVKGRLALGVSAKDLVLHLLALPSLRAGAGLNQVFEFGGSAVRALNTDERATLTNMTAELGGYTGMVEPDEETLRFMRERRGQDFQLEPWMKSDEGAHYSQVIEVDATTLSPMVARPGDPGLGLPLSSLALPHERPHPHIAYGGSCTAGKREDFEQYHAVLLWASQRGLRVASGVQLYLQFGTQDVGQYARSQGWLSAFEAVGAQMLEPACGACANCGPGSSTAPEQITISAINRNFPGRSGPGQVWLASPATVAASAIAGYLCSFEELVKSHG